jgi:hypothetical protein
VLDGGRLTVSRLDGAQPCRAVVAFFATAQSEYRHDRSKRLPANALVAPTNLIAGSRPAEKDTICAVIVNLINRENF